MKKVVFNLLVLTIFITIGCKNSSKNSKEDVIADTLETKTSSENKNDYNLLKSTFNGNEPFWDIVFEEDFAIFKSPGEPEEGIKIFYQKNSSDNNNLKLNEAVVKISDNELKIYGLMDKSNIEITIKKQNCEDGMSPDKYNRKITLLKDNKFTFEGCGNIKE